MKKFLPILNTVALLLALLLIVTGCNSGSSGSSETTVKNVVAVPVFTDTDFVYTGEQIQFLPDNYRNISAYCTISGNTATEAGTYTATIRLKDTASACWSDGTTEEKTFAWSIYVAKTALTTPTEDTESYCYTGKAITYTPVGFDSENETISGNVQISAGTYTVKVSLNNPDEYTWQDGTADDLTFTFTIGKYSIPKPELNADDNGIVPYTGSLITYIPECIDGYSAYLECTGNSSATNAGTYSVTYNLSDPDNTQWSDGTDSEVTLTWEIAKKQYAVPSSDNTVFSCTGNEITFIPGGFDSNAMTIAGNTGKDPGTYTAVISLNDTANTCWDDGSSDTKSISWSITSDRVALTTPTANATPFYYTGKSLTYLPIGYDSNVESISGNVQVYAGTYSVTVSLNDTERYTWADGTIGNLTFVFTIQKGMIDKPVLNTSNGGVLTYTGGLLTYTPDNYEEYTSYITRTGTYAATNAGTYTMTLSLSDEANTQWSDETGDPVTLSWSIQPKQYAVPLANSYSYTGSVITFLPSGYDSGAMTIAGNTGTESGTYTAVVSLKDTVNTCWSDGTTGPVTLSWEIEEVSTSAYYRISSTDTALLLTHNTTGKILSVGFPSGTSFQIDDDLGSLTLSYSQDTSEALVFSLNGEFDGSIRIEVTSDTDVEVDLNGVTVEDDTSCPLCFICAGDVDLVAKKGSVNTIADKRLTLNSTEAYNAAIYSESDLKLKGKGTLTVTSSVYEGIHTKDNLKIQNLTLSVTAYDNALKGNDGVTIDSGDITVISTYSNGIKTSNSSLSAKGNQKGNVEINGGTVNIYSALDGIEAACDVIIDEADTATPTVVSITTCTYSSYTKRTYTSSSSAYSGFSGAFGRPGGGQGGPGGQGGQGGSSGNKNTYSESTKGIKADNTITISGGTVTIKSYDDAIHANNDTVLESTGKVGSGNITISGGAVTVYSMDDGIHADNILTISGGTTTVTNSYEGFEGIQVVISGGTNSVTSTDDGINGTGTSGESIQITGGTNYVYAGGDGVDSNSNTSYDGILFAGGKTVIIQTSGGNSSIDTNQGYKYTGGYVLALGLSSGMSQQESGKCQSALKKTATLSGTTITASGFVTVKMPKSMSVYAIFLGSSSTTLSANASYTDYDSNGVSWNE